ncbi:ppsA [Symbiodinium microadriaticum]|nr:ppsA [Symbiodinium microadriaticum]
MSGEISSHVKPQHGLKKSSMGRRVCNPLRIATACGVALAPMMAAWLMPQSDYFAPLGSGRVLAIQQAGGKASILNKIQSSKLSDAACPDGFVILTAAFEKAVGTHLQDLHELQGHLDAESVDEHKVEELLRRLRTAMLTASLPHAVTRALADFTHDVRNCAVRSSAVGEDSAASAFAGLFESKLHVPSKLEAMEAAVREVWASAFTLRVFQGLKRLEGDVSALKMAVLVQRMVPDVRASGVAFSRNPRTSGGGHRAVSVSASNGVGGVVDGAEQPVEFSVDRASLQAIVRHNSDVAFTAEDATRVAALAISLEKQLAMGPLDIEFAMDAGGKLHLLQARSDVAFPWKPPKEGKWTLQQPQVFIPDGPLAGLSQAPILAGLAEGYSSLASLYGLPSPFTFEVVNSWYVYKQRSAGMGQMLLRLPRALYQIRPYVLQEAWNTDIEEWLQQVQPQLQGLADGFAEVMIQEVDDEELPEHISKVQDFLKEATKAHRRFSTCVFPLLSLMSFTRRCGFAESEQKVLLKIIERKSKLPYRGGLTHAIRNLKAMLDPRAARELWEEIDQGQDAVVLLEQLVRKSGPEEESEAALGVLRAAKAWTFGADIQSPSVHEERDFLSGELWKEFREGGSAGDHDHKAEEKKLEATVPQNHRDEYFRRFRLAVQAAPLREDRFAFHHQATAILRAAVLAVGQRATARKYLDEPEHALAAADLEQLRKLLKGVDMRMAMAAAHRRLKSKNQPLAPKTLPLPPDSKCIQEGESPSTWASWVLAVLRQVPGELSLLTAAEMLLLWQELDNGGPQNLEAVSMKAQEAMSNGMPTGQILHGNSADDAAGEVQGIARVGLDGLKEDEILVVEETKASYVRHFGKLRGLVTDVGGISSHAAINAREFRLPCITGATAATSRIRTGDEIHLDCGTGQVTILSKL